MKSKENVDLTPKKVTQAQIQQRQAAAAVPNGNLSIILFPQLFYFSVPKRTNLNEQQELLLEENANRLQIDGTSARNIDDIIHVLQ